MVLRVVSILLSLVATPLILAWLGDELYGAFRASFEWFGYFALMELGFEGALIPILIKAIGRDDKKSVTEAIGAGIRVFSIITIFKLIASFGLIYFIPSLVPVGIDSVNDLRVGTFLGSLIMISTIFIPLRALVRSEQKNYLVTFLLIIQTLVLTLLGLYFSYMGHGITGQYLAALIGGGIFSAGLVAVTYKSPYLKWNKIPQALKLPMPREMYKLTKPTFIINAATKFSAGSDNVIAVYILGPIAAVPMMLSQRFPQLVQMVLQEFGNSSFASLSSLYASDQKENFNDRVILLSKILCISGISGMVPLAFLNRSVISVWVGNDFYAGDWFTIAALLSAYLAGILALWRWCFMGTGKIEAIMQITTVNAILNIILSIYLTYEYGLIGPVLGTLVSTLVTSFLIFPLKMKSAFNMNASSLYLSSVLPIALWIPVTYFALKWTEFHYFNWSEIIALCVILSVLTFFIGFFVLINKPERGFVFDAAKRILKK